MWGGVTVGDVGTTRKRHRSRREKEKQAKRLPIALIVVVTWLLTVAFVFFAVEALDKEVEMSTVS